MPSRTFNIALKKTLDRKRRAREARWHQYCDCAHASSAKQAAARALSRRVIEHYLSLVDQISNQSIDPRTHPIVYYAHGSLLERVLHLHATPRCIFPPLPLVHIFDPRAKKFNPPRNS
jgi:hypothetical protein